MLSDVKLFALGEVVRELRAQQRTSSDAERVRACVRMCVRAECGFLSATCDRVLEWCVQFAKGRQRWCIPVSYRIALQLHGELVLF